MCTTASVASRRVRLIDRRARASLLAAAVLLGAFGCIGTDAGTSPTNNNQDPTGTYGLTKIDRRNPPLEVYRGPYTDPQTGLVLDPFAIEIVGGEIALNEDGTFLMNLDLRLSTAGAERTTTFTIDGVYELHGTEVYMSAEIGDDTATLRNGVLTLREDIVGFGDKVEFTFRRAP